VNTFQDLARRVNGIAAPIVDVDALVARAEQRLHRRRMAAVLATVAVIAVIAVGGFVARSPHHQSNGPVDKPNQTTRTHKPHQASGSVTRKVAYKDGISGSAVHFDDRLVKTDRGFLPMDVTDDGFVYATELLDSKGDGRLWFSDGGTPTQIGRPCARLMGPDHASILNAAVITGSAGSLVAWVDCTDPSTPALVVRDTSSDREVVRDPTARFATKGGVCCGLIGLIGEHLYLNRGDVRPGAGGYFDQGLMLDLATGQFMTVTGWQPTWDGGSRIPHPPNEDPGPYLDDIRANSRGLVLGDTRQTGVASSGIGHHFVVHGSQLVPQVSDLPSTRVFDTTSGRAVHLRLPPNYPESVGFTLFEWLNDDTVALIAGNESGISSWPGGLRYGDIVTCRLSSGSCHLAVRGPRWSSDADARVVPHLPIPE
jgi:hypothetical protein